MRHNGGILEKTPRTGKGKKEVSREIDLSEHLRYERETSDHPSPYRARNLEELRSIILDDKEGPRRYEFLSKAIAYDKILYEKSFPL